MPAAKFLGVSPTPTLLTFRPVTRSWGRLVPPQALAAGTLEQDRRLEEGLVPTCALAVTALASG